MSRIFIKPPVGIDLKTLVASFPIVHKLKQVFLPTGADEWGEVVTSTWTTESIDVNDKSLRSKLSEVLDDVPGLEFDVDVLAFKPPFAPFLHKWSTFKALLNNDNEDAHTKSLLKQLYEIVAPSISPTLDRINTARDGQTIDWDLLRASCVPGELIYESRQSHSQAYKIVQSEICMNGFTEYLKLVVEYYDWDGRKSGFRLTEFHVKKFSGEKSLKDLDYIPFKFLKEPEQISEKLIARGKTFEQMIRCHFKYYSGTKLSMTPSGRTRKGQLNGRIIIDAYAYHRFFSEQWIENKKKITNDDYPSDPAKIIEEEAVYDDSDRNEDIRPFSTEQHLLSLQTLKAFDLANREWCQVYIDGGLSDIEFNNNASDKLVLDKNEKMMILAFSQQIRDSETRFDDIIQNKGRGIIMLLCGPPGVGKTLTAESVAERAHLPLYAVHAGEIGHDAGSADQALHTILECCRLWNAVLLLDEADVFLEARGSDNLVRNELVSVFLRRLEYFGGLSFLTTNQPKCIDPAFESRLDLIIPYPDLDASARRLVWKTFISRPEKSNGHEISDADYDKLAEHKCNGREIKNIVKISLMLATQDQAKLTMSHIDTVLQLRTKAAKTLGTRQFS